MTSRPSPLGRRPERAAGPVLGGALTPLQGAVQNYAWGSPTAIPDLLGKPADGRPVAEVWFGAHPASPSLVGPVPGGIGLIEALEAEPDALGRHPHLPFLLKLLAADKALSLQVHPDLEQAQAGFRREEELGGAAGRPRRYVDANHKPELVVALTPFRALAGVRPVAEILHVVERLDCRPLREAYEPLFAEPNGSGVAAVLGRLLRLSRGDTDQLLAALRSAVRRSAERPAPDSDPLVARAVDLIGVLERDHPDDVGAAAALLLNDVTLRPGEGLFQPAGMLHAYVRGLGVEVMASSDNVLRGGLTTKLVDVDELLAVLRPRPGVAAILPAPAGPVGTWPVPIADFRLRRVTAGGVPIPLPTEGPAIALSSSGVVRVEARGASHELPAGGAAFVAADAGPLAVSGSGELFVADCPD